MNERTSLKIVLAIALFGLIFSGILSYQELFVSKAFTCPSLGGAPGTIFGYPACVYGFFMYLIIVLVSALGIFKH